MRLCGKLRCSKRALPLALCTSIGCCSISTSTECVVGVVHWQMQVLCARRQMAHIGRVMLIGYAGYAPVRYAL
jgi:hypothetical protein